MHKFIFQVFENQREVLLFNKDIKNFNKIDANDYQKYSNIDLFNEDGHNNIIIQNHINSYDFDSIVLLLRNDSFFKEEEISKEYINTFNEKYDHHVVITKNINCYYQIEKEVSKYEGDIITFFVVPIETFTGYLPDSETTVLIDGFDYTECMESIFSAKENQTVEELREHLNSFGWTEKIIFDDDYNLVL